jgi:diaminopimelate epimerase
MRVSFVKMHGCGNDFVVFDERKGALGLTPARAAAIANRRTGVGCDQFIVIEPARAGPAPTLSCASAIPTAPRPAPAATPLAASPALLAAETGRDDQVIRTISGDLASEVLPDGRVRVDMGPVRLDWQDIPLARPMDTLDLDLRLGPVSHPAAANMGNPHATFFVPDIAAVPRSPNRSGAGARRAVPRASQYRLRPGAGPGPDAACGSGNAAPG